MTPRELVLVGAGGFAREALDVLEAVNASAAAPLWSVTGVIDDAPSSTNLERLADRTVPYLGTIDEWLRSRPNCVNVVVGIGSPHARRRVVDLIDSSIHVSYPVVVHPRADIGSHSSFGAGTVVCGGVQVSTNVRTGRHIHINPSATIGHDTTLMDFVSVNPAATVSGDCHVDEMALLGAGSVILQGRRVGAGAVVGAAACVVRDVSARATVMGVPAR